MRKHVGNLAHNRCTTLHSSTRLGARASPAPLTPYTCCQIKVIGFPGYSIGQHGLLLVPAVALAGAGLQEELAALEYAPKRGWYSCQGPTIAAGWIAGVSPATKLQHCLCAALSTLFVTPQREVLCLFAASFLYLTLMAKTSSSAWNSPANCARRDVDKTMQSSLP